MLFSCIRPSLSKIYIYHHIIFSYNREKFQNIYRYVLACILALRTSLFKPRELGQYFKNSKKLFCFLLISVVTTLYVKCIPDIKFLC
jgi:hypothetical protein